MACKFWIITKDVYLKNVKSISFLVMTLVPFIMLGVVYVAGNFVQQNSDVNKIGVLADNEQISQQMSQVKTDDFGFKAADSEEKTQKELSEKRIDAYLVASTENDKTNGMLYSENSLGQSTQLLIQQQLTDLQSMLRASRLGILPEEVTNLSQQANLTRQKVNLNLKGKMTVGEDNSTVQYVVSYIATIVLLIIILTYAQIIAQEIASEKGTRIMEVVLSSTTAQKHFYGKPTGILLVALTQVALYGTIFGIGYSQFEDMEMVKNILDDISLDNLIGPSLWYSLLFMIFGILIFSVLAALCDSSVNKAEDTVKTILPVTYLSLGGYMLGLILGASDPNNIVIRITSHILFLSSCIMPVRLANETAGMGGALISLLVLVAVTFLLTILSANVYKSDVLVYSEDGLRSSLRQSISIMRNERKKA